MDCLQNLVSDCGSHADRTIRDVLCSTDVPDASEYLDIFDGIQFLFWHSVISIVTTLKLLWRYSLGLLNIQSYMNKLWNTFIIIWCCLGVAHTNY